jgi:hypothetical protein
MGYTATLTPTLSHRMGEGPEGRVRKAMGAHGSAGLSGQKLVFGALVVSSYEGIGPSRHHE